MRKKSWRMWKRGTSEIEEERLNGNQRRKRKTEIYVVKEKITSVISLTVQHMYFNAFGFCVWWITRVFPRVWLLRILNEEKACSGFPFLCDHTDSPSGWIVADNLWENKEQVRLTKSKTQNAGKTKKWRKSEINKD